MLNGNDNQILKFNSVQQCFLKLKQSLDIAVILIM